jgi:hypothetical protein
VVVLLVNFKVFVEVVDSLGEESDLYFGRTGVAFVGCVLCNDFVLFHFFFILLWNGFSYLREKRGESPIPATVTIILTHSF